MKWFNTLSHNRWLEQETDRILDFGKNAVLIGDPRPSPQTGTQPIDNNIWLGLYNDTTKIKPAPKSWGVLYDAKYKGQITVPKAVRDALGIGEGAEQNAPLGRAVIGGEGYVENSYTINTSSSVSRGRTCSSVST